MEALLPNLKGKLRNIGLRFKQISLKFLPLKPGSSLDSIKSSTKPVAQLALAVILGAFGYSETRLGAVNDWKKSHFPSDSLVHRVLSSYGFLEIQEGPELHRIARGLPSELDSERSIWIHDSSYWILYFKGEEAVLPFQVFCINCDPQPSRTLNSKNSVASKKAKKSSSQKIEIRPENWKLVGKGWEGIENLDQLLGKNPALTEAHPTAKTVQLKRAKVSKSPYADPRSINY